MKRNHRKVLRDNDFKNWFTPAIRRLMKDQNIGPYRVSPSVFEPLGDYSQQVLFELINKSMINAHSAGLKTISSDAIRLAAGPKYNLSSEPTEKCSSLGNDDKNVHYMSKVPFKRLIKQLGQDVEVNALSNYSMRWSSDSIYCLLDYIETVISNILSMAILAVAHAKRQTLTADDIYLVIANRINCERV